MVLWGSVEECSRKWPTCSKAKSPVVCRRIIGLSRHPFDLRLYVTSIGRAVLYFTCFSAMLDWMLPTPGIFARKSVTNS